jgi:hypothetical protein
MKRFAYALVLTLIAANSFSVSTESQTKSATFAETRQLLLAMERSYSDKAFIKLFEEADIRSADLIQALDDAEERVSLHAQTIILYLADPQGLAALDKWRARSDKYWTAWTGPVRLVEGAKFLTGNDGELAGLVLKNLYPNEKDFRAKVIAYNKRTNTAVVEVVDGSEVFTSGIHVTIRLENGCWRILSNFGVWEY